MHVLPLSARHPCAGDAHRALSCAGVLVKGRPIVAAVGRLPRHLQNMILIAALAGVPSAATAQSMRYERIVYPRAVITKITGINDRGTIIGSYTLADLPAAPRGLACVPTTHSNCITELTDAFIYADKNYSRLRGPEGAGLQLVAINNQDQVLLRDSHGKGNGWFLYDIAKDTFTPIGLSGQLSTAKGVKTIHLRNITGLNDKGEILAIADAGHVFGRPVLGVPGSVTPPAESGQFTLIPNCQGGNKDINGINARGQVVGSCHHGYKSAGMVVFATAYSYRDGVFQSIVEPDAIVTTATAINNGGVIAGFYQPQKTFFSRSFIYDGAKFTEIPVKFNPTGNIPATIRASGINNHGQVVGTVQGGINEGTVEGFLATPQ
jgi:hypothetical protein